MLHGIRKLVSLLPVSFQQTGIQQYAVLAGCSLHAQYLGRDNAPEFDRMRGIPDNGLHLPGQTLRLNKRADKRNDQR